MKLTYKEIAMVLPGSPIGKMGLQIKSKPVYLIIEQTTRWHSWLSKKLYPVKFGIINGNSFIRLFDILKNPQNAILYYTNPMNQMDEDFMEMLKRIIRKKEKIEYLRKENV